ncbi:MAG: hypothetical protein ACK4VM_02240 [Bosea sp. (in: a-proteobacteria)]
MRYALLKSNRNYRLLLSGSVVANLGDGIAAVAMPWLATLLTRDPVMISPSQWPDDCHGSSSPCQRAS